MQQFIKKIGNKGEVVIPKNIRLQKHLDANTEVQIISTKSAILIIPLKKKISDLAGLFSEDGIKDIGEVDAVAHEIFAGM